MRRRGADERRVGDMRGDADAPDGREGAEAREFDQQGKYMWLAVVVGTVVVVGRVAHVRSVRRDVRRGLLVDSCATSGREKAVGGARGLARGRASLGC